MAPSFLGWFQNSRTLVPYQGPTRKPRDEFGIWEEVPEETPPEPAEEAETVNYIANKNTMKFHYPDCSSVDDMKEKNKLYWTGTRDELIDKGYDPCQRCYP